MLDAAGGGTKVPKGQEFPCQTHTHTLTHSLTLSLSSVGPSSLWTHGDYLPCLLFFCSSSSPGTPGIPRKVLCEFPYHTSSSWSGGIICRKGSKRKSGRQQPPAPTPHQGGCPLTARRSCPSSHYGHVDTVAAPREPHWDPFLPGYLQQAS